MMPIPSAVTPSHQSTRPAEVDDTNKHHGIGSTAGAPSPPSVSLPASTASSTTAQKRKRKVKDAHMLHTCTFRNPRWSYFHLSLTVSPSPTSSTNKLTTTTTTSTTTTAKLPPPSLDLDLNPLTTLALLTQPLTSFLGLHGSAIPLDILHTARLAVTIRLPREERSAFRAALSTWVGTAEAGLVPGWEGRGDQWGRVKVSWRVVGEGENLGVVAGEGGGDGRELFG